MEELKKFLEDRGYKFYKNYIDLDNKYDWYACKRTDSKRLCNCNEKPVQIVVWPYHSVLPDNRVHKNVSVDISGEYRGIWWKLEAYSLSVKELMDNLGVIEESLIKAWEAL